MWGESDFPVTMGDMTRNNDQKEPIMNARTATVKNQQNHREGSAESPKCAGMPKPGLGIRRTLVAGTAVLCTLGVSATIAPSMAYAAPPAAVSSVASAASSEEEVQAAIDRLRADGMWFEDTGLKASAADFVDPVGMAKDFGMVAFNQLFTYQGGSGILDPLLEALGFADTSLTDSLDEINTSIKQLRDDLGTISTGIEGLLDGQDQTNYLTSYNSANTAAGRLNTSLKSVSSWVDQGLTPTESQTSDLQTTVRNSISDLSGATTNSTAGTIPLMMKAQPERLSDLEGYWDDVETARASYRASLAQGIAALDVLTRWDATGTVAADLTLAVDDSQEAVQGLYDYGVAVDQATTRSSALVTVGDTVYAPSDAPGADGESWAEVSYHVDELEPVLKDMAAGYDPADHGGQSLESYLTERGVETRALYLGTFTLSKQDDGAFWYYTPVATEGRIVGNSYESSVVPLGPETESESSAKADRDAAERTVESKVALRSLPANELAGEATAPMPSVNRYLHVREADALLAPGTYEGNVGETWTDVGHTKAELAPILNSFVDSYRADEHDGATLEEVLADRGFPTTVYYADTARLNKVEGSIDWDYQAVVTRASIIGNEYVTAEVPVGVQYTSGDTKAKATADMNKLTTKLGLAPALRTMSVDLDRGGHAASFDADAIHEAAFGVTG